MSEKNKTITINGVEYAVKPGMKAIIIFETFRNKQFEIKTTSDILSYIYSSILSAKPDANLDWDEMLDAFDEDPGLFKAAVDSVITKSAAERIVQLSNDDGGPEPKKE